MILKILLGIDLFLAFSSSIFIILSIISDLVNSNNPAAYTKDMVSELRGHSGARVLAGLVASLCWTIFIMCLI